MSDDSKIKPYVDDGKIVVLYISLDKETISLDKETWKKKWKENIKFNQLEGYHTLANDVFVQDMWQTLGGEEGAIPGYALIDKKGNIVLNDAVRPSDGQKLSRQIEDLLSESQ